MEKRRIEWIDIAKGIAILLVLYGHSMRDEMREQYSILDFTYRCVYIFHMSFFFWLSGFSYEMGRSVYHKKYDLSFIIKKLRKQLLPWILYSAVIYVVFTIAMNIKTVSSVLTGAGYYKISILEYIQNAVCANNRFAYHLWFIYVLFIISIIVFIAERFVKNLSVVHISSIVLSFIGLLLVQRFDVGKCERLLNYLCLYIPFYVMGILMQGKVECIKHSFIWEVLGVGYILLRAKLWSGASGNSVEAGGGMV